MYLLRERSSFLTLPGHLFVTSVARRDGALAESWGSRLGLARVSCAGRGDVRKQGGM